jgi:broad specificity phosphatase PhoE
MPIYIYIRHARKKYKNGKSNCGSQHDPPIELLFIEEIKKTSMNLIEKYGVPDKILLSPYLRIRQTANILVSEFPIKEPLYKNIFYDFNISEYLGHQKGFIDLSPQTKEFFDIDKFPQPGESLKQLKDRVCEHLKDMNIQDNNDNNISQYNSIWIVTHGLVIKTLYDVICTFSKCKSQKFDKYYPSELDYLIVKINSDNTIELLIK